MAEDKLEATNKARDGARFADARRNHSPSCFDCVGGHVCTWVLVRDMLDETEPGCGSIAVHLRDAA